MFRTKFAQVEFGLCLAISVVVYVGGPWLPASVTVSALTLICACGLLAQGLIRDIWIVSRARDGENAGQQKVAACICAESAIGTVGVVLGILLAGLQVETVLAMSEVAWAATAFSVLIFGFLMKDVVITLRPLGIAREPDHINVVFGWRGARSAAIDDR